MDWNSQYHPYTQLVYRDQRLSFAQLGRRSPEAAEHGDADFYASQTEFVVRAALSDLTEARLGLPFRRLGMSVDEDDEHHRDESMSGLGDVRLSLRHFFWTSPTGQAAATFGLSLPTGRLNRLTAAAYLGHEEAMDLGVTVAPHSHLRLGTGTVDPLLGLEGLRRFENGWMLYGSVSAAVPLMENRYDYRTAPSLVATLGPASRLGGSALVGALFGELTWSGRDQFDGADVVGPGGTFDGSFGVPNTGRLELAVVPSLTWQPTDRVTLNFQARVPVYTRIREDAENRDIQLTEPVGFLVGLTYGF